MRDPLITAAVTLAIFSQLLSCLKIRDILDQQKYDRDEINEVRVEIECLAQGNKLPYAYRLAHCNKYPLTND